MTERSDPARFITRATPRIYDKSHGTFDFETRGLGGEFLDCSMFTTQGPARVRSLSDCLKAMLDPPRDFFTTARGEKRPRRNMFTWFAHNGAKYDFTYLATMIRDYAVAEGITVQTTQQGTKIIALDIPTKKGKVRIADSFPLLYCDLAGAAKAYAPEYAKQGHCPDHDFTKKGVYYSPDCQECVRYMIRDSEALWHVIENFRGLIVKTFGVMPGLTTGSTALRAWQAMIPEGHVYYRQSPEKEAFLRKVGCGSIIYPGYTSEVWEPAPGDELAAVTADRGAAFAACMLEGEYPVSTGIWVCDYRPDMLGYWEVDAYCPEDIDFPVIPYTTDKGARIYATGHGRAYITSEQYRYAQQCGYSLAVVQGLIFEKAEDIFSAFINRCQDLEYPPDGTPADPAIKSMAKNMRNSLNGKFNIREMMDRIYYGEPPRDEDGHIIDGTNPVLDDDGNEVPGVYSLPEAVDAPYAHPDWYALTVTRQQITMIRLIKELDPDRRGKVDTDSITTTPAEIDRLVAKGLIILGPGYGNWKIEHGWIWLQSLGPKNYRGLDGEGELLNYCKGIPRRVLKEHRYEHELAGAGVQVQISFESLRTYQDMIKHGLQTPGLVRVRSISTPGSVTGWRHDTDSGKFSPHHLT